MGMASTLGGRVAAVRCRTEQGSIRLRPGPSRGGMVGLGAMRGGGGTQAQPAHAPLRPAPLEMAAVLLL